MKETDGRPVDEDADDRTALESDKELTPPHGDELRQEVTSGRGDRYATVDDEQGTQERPAEGAKDQKGGAKER